jgi:hypothetical protein
VELLSSNARRPMPPTAAASADSSGTSMRYQPVSQPILIMMFMCMVAFETIRMHSPST